MLIVFLVIVLDLIGFGIMVPILAYYVVQLGGGPELATFCMALYAIGMLISTPILGRLSDFHGRRPILMLSMVGAIIGYLMLGFAESLWVVALSRLLAGLMAGNIAAAQAYITDITSEENRAKGMGLIGAAFGLGIVLGPMLGGLLSGDSASFTLPCIFAGGMSVLAIIAAALFLPESLPAERRAAHRQEQRSGQRLSVYKMLHNTGNRLLTLQYVLHTLCVSSLTYLFPLWAGDLLQWNAKEVGIVFGVQGAIMVLFQGGLMGPLVRWLGEWQFLRLAVSTFFLGLLCAAFATTMPFMVGSMFVAMTGATLCMPLMNTIVSQRTPTQYRGRMLGTSSAAASWGRVIGPLMAGTNLALFGYRGAWLGCVFVISFYLIWVFREYTRQKNAATGAIRGGS